MLSLTRKPGEGLKLILQDGTSIDVVHLGKNRIGIAAPKSIKILRDECEPRDAPPPPRPAA